MDGDFDGVLGIGGDSNDGRGSNWSINSNGSRISNKSHEDSMNGGNSNGINIIDFSHHNDESNGLVDILINIYLLRLINI